MKAYTVYNPETGEIYKTGHCQDCDFLDQAGDYGIAEGIYDDETFYWFENNFIAKPERPSDYHKFNYDLRCWELDGDYALSIIRAKRNALLADCDWTQNADVPENTREMWKAYRQSLRDITDQPLETLTWPEMP